MHKLDPWVVEEDYLSVLLLSKKKESVGSKLYFILLAWLKLLQREDQMTFAPWLGVPVFWHYTIVFRVEFGLCAIARAFYLK